ncbi:MAG: AAA family ATPase [Acidimicrobiia bacterium]
MLIVLNGAPGVGKSALADRYGDDHALALVIDIDVLRQHLGQWEKTEASRDIARDLAVALARNHLGRGYDVIVPQYFGRRNFVERLRLIAEEVSVQFVEVILSDDTDSIVARFRRRRAEFSSLGVRHPEADLSDEAVAAAVRAANDGLRRDALTHHVAMIETAAGIDAAYRALCGAISNVG